MHWQYSILFNTFSITSITFIHFTNSFIYWIYFTISNFFTNFSRIHLFIRFFTRILSFNQNDDFYFKIRIFHFRIVVRFSFLIFFFLHLHFCEWHFHESINNARFSIFVQTTLTKSNQSKMRLIRSNKKNAKNYLVRKHESKIKNKFKQKAKKLIKQQKKIRLIKKRIEKYTCKRCKYSIKFDNNIKFYEHIRIRHAKKSKSTFVQQFVEFVVLSFIFSVSLFFSSFQSIISSFFTSSKLIIESSITFIFEKFLSKFLSIATSRKSIFWTEIVLRSIIASKFFRFSIATFKSMCKFSKNANIVCSSISFRTFISSKFYLIVNDLYHMFVEKSNSFNLQRYQMRFFFARFWQMQFRKQMWFHTKLYYVIFSCNNYICFQIDQIRNI